MTMLPPRDQTEPLRRGRYKLLLWLFLAALSAVILLWGAGQPPVEPEPEPAEEPEQEEVLPDLVTAEQLERLRDGCRTYKEKALVEFLVSSGCRLGELVGIQVDAVDWQGRSVVVLGKGGKERTVYFSVRAKLMLQEYLARRKGGEALFASSRTPYEAMKPRAVEKALQKIGDRAGEARRVHPHLMRHTFASNALNAGMDITIIQHLLGHTDPKTTLIYAELAPRTVKYEYERVVA